MPRPRPTLVLLALALPAVLAAQQVPRVHLSVGGGTVPRDDGAVDRMRVAGLTAAAGVRVPVWRRAYVEGAAQVQGALDFNDDLTLIADGGGFRTLTTGGDAGTGLALLARVGTELLGGAGRPTVRAAAGVGTMRVARGPMTTLSAGLSTPGRRARFTVDLDGWWYRAQAIDSRLAPPSLGVAGAMIERPVRVGLRSTLVRFGVEVPLTTR
jgi:hypothetical protein